MRFTNWMKSGSQAVGIGVFCGLLVTIWLACPLMMGLQVTHAMPCSETHHKAPECPSAICQASSPYVAAQLNSDVPHSQELNTAIVVPALLLTFFEYVEAVPRDEGSPPGFGSRLFLHTHSLLI